MILFDVQAVQSKAHGERGIARFCLELALAIEARNPHRIDYFVVNPHLEVPRSLDVLRATGRVVASDDVRLQRSVDLLHVGSPLELGYSIDKLFFSRPRKLVVNLFDLIPAIFEKHYLVDPTTASKYWARLGFYTAADVVLADSQSAVDDAIEILGVPASRLRVIGAGTSARFSPHPDGPVAALSDVRAEIPGIRAGFVLLPAGIDWRKNIEGVLEAYSHLDRGVRTAHQLVLTCRIADSERTRLEALADEFGCGETFLITGFVSDDLLVALNRAAHLVILPSRYEGFGLPILEARRCGTPVICGDNSSLREVVPDPAARFDSDSTESIHAMLERALTDQPFYERLVEMEVPPFSWDEAARRTLEAYDDLLLARSPATILGSRRPTIAYVTPMPPQRSGIADYSYRFLRELSRIANVRCFVDEDPSTVLAPHGVRVVHLDDLAVRFQTGEFDHVIFALGNNRIHQTSLDALRQIGGAVHLHDVRLVNCYGREPWPNVVERHYPGRYAAEQLSAMTSPIVDAVHDGSVFLLADVARFADRVMVHSRHAAELVYRERRHRNGCCGAARISACMDDAKRPPQPCGLVVLESCTPASSPPRLLARLSNCFRRDQKWNSLSSVWEAI